METSRYVKQFSGGVKPMKFGVSGDFREFDVVIFGASGFTGRHVVEEFANSTKNSDIKWAVAGRNIEKVQSILQEVQQYMSGIDILNTPIIKADICDQKSILNMCKKAKIILNCVGPYKLYGEPVISACIEVKTHHVDMCAEFSFFELIQANYFNAAREKGVYIVQACGFVSIPGDYGISLLKNNFPGDLNSVEYYVELKHGPLVRTLNIETFSKMREFFSVDFVNFFKYRNTNKDVFKKELVESKYKLHRRLPPLFFSNVINSWCFWFLGPNERVIKTSQIFRNSFYNERPVQIHGYFKMLPLLRIISLLFFGVFFGFLSCFKFGRSLLEKYAEYITFGLVSKEGLTREQVEQCSSVFTFIGEGWKYKISEPTDEHSAKPDTKMKLTITGPEAAYPFTSMCMVHAGLVVLEERDKMPLDVLPRYSSGEKSWRTHLPSGSSGQWSKCKELPSGFQCWARHEGVAAQRQEPRSGSHLRTELC